MRCLAFRHAPHEGLGAWGPPLRDLGWQVEERDLFRREDVPEQAARPEVDLLVVLGGPMSLCDTGQVEYLQKEIDVVRRRLLEGLPTLGICLGAQMMAAALGGRVYQGPQPEVGWGPVELLDEGRLDPVFAHLLTPSVVTLHWHADTYEIPDGCVPLAGSQLYKNQAFRHGLYSYAIQFHPEVPLEDLPIWTSRSHIPLIGPPDAPTPRQIVQDGSRFGPACLAQGLEFLREYLRRVTE